MIPIRIHRDLRAYTQREYDALVAKGVEMIRHEGRTRILVCRRLRRFDRKRTGGKRRAPHAQHQIVAVQVWKVMLGDWVHQPFYDTARPPRRRRA